jgi:hypothetical protein
METLYETGKDPDGFLYITYTDETTLSFRGLGCSDICCCFSMVSLVLVALLWTMRFTCSWYFGGISGFTPGVSPADFRSESIVQDYENRINPMAITPAISALERHISLQCRLQDVETDRAVEEMESIEGMMENLNLNLKTEKENE